MSNKTPKVNLNSQDITQETIKELKKLILSAFREDKIDFDALKTALGEIVEPNREFYNFSWAGKSEAFKHIQQPSTATLKPCRDESVDFGNTENIFIEGDNLEVLKLLQKSYYGKIKMIYIDPPYNKDFVYPDRWSEGIKSYKEYCKFINEGGDITTTDSEASTTVGRKHSHWLTMMYPRLFLARNLLKEDGVIFISIDDSEVHNLRKICDEIFGEENFEGHIHWRRRHNQPNDKSKMIGLVIDMLYELLLKKGYDLNSKIESKNINKNEIFIVNSKMYVCLDEEIFKETIVEIIKLKPQQFIVLDRAFNGDDELKTNTFQTFKTLYKNSINPFETV